MPVRVHVHAAIWIDGKLAVQRRSRHGVERLSLPGGRVKDRESVFEALRREAREEINCEIEVDTLLLAGEVRASSLQGIVLVFAARADTTGARHLALIDPATPEAATVLPPVVTELYARRAPARADAWLGNLYRADLAGGGGLAGPSPDRPG